MSDEKGDGPTIEGYLEKKAATGMAGWQKRYFVAKKGKLVYWKNEQERHQRGSKHTPVSLKGAQIVKMRKEDGTIVKAGFIIESSDRKLELRADTAQKAVQWREKLAEVRDWKKQKTTRNASILASAEDMPFMEAGMTVTLPGSAPRELWVRVSKQDKKMTFAESQQRMSEGKASAAASVLLTGSQLSKHGKNEFRLHVTNPTKRSYAFVLADKADLQTWTTALLMLGVSYMKSSDAGDDDDGGGAAAASASSSSSSERRRTMNVKSSSSNGSADGGGGGAAAADDESGTAAAAAASSSSSSSSFSSSASSASSSKISSKASSKASKRASTYPEASKASGAAAAASVPSFAEEAWIREYDSLLKTPKGRQTAELNLYNEAVRFFIMEGDEERSGASPGPDDFLEPTPDLDVHQTVECAQRLIDDLNVRYTDCSPNRMDVFEVCLKVYNLRLTTQLDILGISRTELLAEFTPEELKITIQVCCVCS
jgi:hypothetical protein